MHMSTFCEMKYMNRLGFFKGQIFDRGLCQNTNSHTRTKITLSPPPPTHTHNNRGYERVYKFKEQYMNVLTFCEINYMNKLGF